MAAERSGIGDLILVGGDVVDGARRRRVAVRDDRTWRSATSLWRTASALMCRKWSPPVLSTCVPRRLSLLARHGHEGQQGVTGLVVINCGISLAPLTFTEME